MLSCIPYLVRTKSSIQKNAFKACFDLNTCQACECAQNCPTIIQNNNRVFYFDDDMAQMQKRVHAIESLQPQRRKIRPNIEATVDEYGAFAIPFNQSDSLQHVVVAALIRSALGATGNPGFAGFDCGLIRIICMLFFFMPNADLQ